MKKSEKEYSSTFGNTRWYWPGTFILHRLDGPALERADGTKEWWVHGSFVCDREDDFKKFLAERICVEG